MAEYSNYSKIPLNEHRSQQYVPAEVQADETDTSSIYHKEDGDKQPSLTLLKNQHFAKPELYSEGDQPPPYTLVEHICVVTDTSPTFNNVPALVDQPTSLASFVPYELEYQKISTTKTKMEDIDEPPAPGSNYRWLAILCLCCSVIPGGIAFAYATKANKARARGDYDAARKYNRWALIWIVSSFVCGIFSIISYLKYEKWGP
ncbi:uncharacterized protein LOC134683871 [Mytilus trossulus]|uniref:uncharacterized protein LOC134683871 n=1 Tax=Mytilus trossulus TaxID=6551 RepID=UPI00300427FB